MGVSTRRGARTSPSTAAVTTNGALTTSPPSSTNHRTKAPSPKAISKEIDQIVSQLKETLDDQAGAQGEVYQFYASAILRLYGRLLELYDSILAPNRHVDTPRPNVHPQSSIESLDTEIISLYDVLESHMPTKKSDAGKKLLRAEIVSSQHRLCYLISERIRLGQQDNERRALPAVAQGSFGDYHVGDGNVLFGSSAHSFVAPSTTTTSAFPTGNTLDGTFPQGIMAPPPARTHHSMHHPPSLFSPTPQGATTSRRPRATFSSTRPQGSFSNTQFDQGGGTKITFEELAMQGMHASRGVEAPPFHFGSGSTASAATRHTPMTEPSFTFREPTVPTPPTSFSFGKATPSTAASPIFGESFAGGSREAFQKATALGAATCSLPSSLRFGSGTSTSEMPTPGSDRAVGSVASSMSHFSMSSPAPRRESFSFVPTPRSSNSRSTKRTRSVVRN